MINKKSFRKIFYFATIIFLLIYVYKRKEDFAELLNAGIANISLIIFISLLALISNSLLFYKLTKSQVPLFKKSFTKKLSLQLTAINSFYNYILPFSGGLAVRAKYMKDYLNLSYLKYAQISYINLSINILSSSILGIVLIYTCSVYNSRLLLICTAFFIISLMLIYIDKIVNSIKNQFGYLSKFIEKFGQLKFKLNYKSIVVLCLINSVFIFFSAIRFQFAGQILVSEINMSHAVIIIGLSNISRLLSITPGNLGIKEGLISSISTLLGYKFTDIMAIAIIDRSAAFLVVMFVGYISEKALRGKRKTS